MVGRVLLLALIALIAERVQACSCATYPPHACRSGARPVDVPGRVIFLGTATEFYPKSERDYKDRWKALSSKLPGPKNDPATGSPSLATQAEWNLEVNRRVLLSFWRNELPPDDILKIERASKWEELWLAGHWMNIKRVRLKVEEVFSGEAGETFELFTGTGGADCSSGFEAGERYLVYASLDKKSGKWTTGVCSGTAAWRYAKDEVMGYRAWNQGKPLPPRIHGYLADATRKDGAWPTYDAIEGLTVRLSGQGITSETKTDNDGHFAFEGLEPGKYVVEMVSEGWSSMFASKPVRETIDLSQRRCGRTHWWLNKK
jgi:hypothetical protein